MGRRSTYFSSSDEERIVKEILLTHVSDSQRVEFKSLLGAIKNIVHHACTSNLASRLSTLNHTKFIANEVPKKADGNYGSVGLIIFSLSFQVMRQILDDDGTYETVISIFDLLGNYQWGSKVVLTLAAFAKSYGEYLLIAQLYDNNPHETSIALLKQVPRNMKDVKAHESCFKALKCLLKTLVEVIKGIIALDDLPERYVTQKVDEMTATRVLIHMAAYWVIRSCVTCFSVSVQLMARSHEQVILTGSGLTWELWSLVYRLNSVHQLLRGKMDTWDQFIEANVGKQLGHLFKKIHDDNQEVLDIFLTVKDSPITWESLSPGKVSLQELANKEVLLLITTIDISLRQLLLLMQQIYSSAQENLDNSYDIVWIPLPNSSPWTTEEMNLFNELANHLPCYSTSEPWCLLQAVEKFIKESWHFEHDPLVVTLDHQGRVVCLNAIDMIMIWGAKAYPFSASREEELWRETSWSIEFIMGGINSLTPMRIEEGKTVCVYGSNNLEWTIQFARQIVNLKKAGALIELIYVGNNNVEEKVKEIIAFIFDQKLGSYLPEAKIYLFWSRLISMRNSRTRLAIDGSADVILQEVESLLNWDASMSSWVLFGSGSSDDILKLEANKAIELLSLHSIWGHYTGKAGLLNALKVGLNPPLRSSDLCGNKSLMAFSEVDEDHILLCEKCSSPMEKCVLYQCNGKHLKQ